MEVQTLEVQEMQLKQWQPYLLVGQAPVACYLLPVHQHHRKTSSLLIVHCFVRAARAEVALRARKEQHHSQQNLMPLRQVVAFPQKGCQ
jgi:hypothetical protein